MGKMVRVAIIAVVLALLTGCPQTSQVTLPPPGSTPLQRLFVANPNASNVLIFPPPFSSASTPSSLSSTGPIGVSLDSTGILAVVNGLDTVTVYAAGVTSASVPYGTFTGSGSNGGLPSFDASGKLYAPNETTVDVFTPPFSNASVPSSTISSVANAFGSAFDTSANLYLTNGAGGVSVLAPPYTGSPITTSNGLPSPRGVAVIGGQLFVANFSPPAIRVHALPLTTNKAPSFSFASGVCPEGLAADTAGNLYAADACTPDVLIFNPPYSSSSTPAVTIPASAGFTVPIFGIALGK